MGVSCTNGVVKCLPLCQCGSWPHWPHSHFDCQCAPTDQSGPEHSLLVGYDAGAENGETADLGNAGADGAVAVHVGSGVAAAREGHSPKIVRSWQNCGAQK